MDGWDEYWYAKLDQGTIVYDIEDGKVYGGSDRRRTVKQIKRDSDGFYPGGDFTMELDLSNRTLVMEVDNEKIIIDGNIGDFNYSPIVILYEAEITLL